MSVASFEADIREWADSERTFRCLGLGRFSSPPDDHPGPSDGRYYLVGVLYPLLAWIARPPQNSQPQRKTARILRPSLDSY